MTIACELAARIAALDLNMLPPEAIANAKRAILDTAAVTLAGAKEKSVQLLIKVLGVQGEGPSAIFGTPLRSEPLNAALINGVAAHALDFDDVNITMGGHPSAPILPALFAVAETISCTGAEFLEAYIAGFEAETAIARGVTYFHYEKGWHPTSTLGVFGATAACARLLKLSEQEIAVALAIAVSLSAGVKANFGTMTKPLHVGHCARNGLLAVLMAREGFSANTGAFEHKQGYFNVFNGTGNYDVEAIFKGWAAPLNIVNPGAGVKLYSCCDSTHSAIDGMLSLRKKHRLKVDQVARVDIRVNGIRMPHVNRPDPQSETDALFSVQYCTARALLDGKISLEHFKGDAYRDPQVRDLMARIHGEAVTDPAFDSPGHYTTELIVSMEDGEIYRMLIEQPFGRSSLDPLPIDLLHAKFNDCTTPVLGAGQTATLLSRIENMETLTSIHEITSLVSTTFL